MKHKKLLKETKIIAMHYRVVPSRTIPIGQLRTMSLPHVQLVYDSLQIEQNNNDNIRQYGFDTSY